MVSEEVRFHARPEPRLRRFLIGHLGLQLLFNSRPELVLTGMIPYIDISYRRALDTRISV